MANESLSPARNPTSAPTGGRWRRFGRSSRPLDGRRPLTPNLSWRDLLNRHDALVLDVRPKLSRGFSETLQVASIDTTGAARFVALGRPLTRSAAVTADAAGASNARTEAKRSARADRHLAGNALPWPEVHGHLVRALETAGVVLAWDVQPKAHLLTRTARRHGLRLPELPWRDLRLDYRRFGYPGDSLTVAAKRHLNGGRVPGPLARCHLALAVMRACTR